MGERGKGMGKGVGFRGRLKTGRATLALAIPLLAVCARPTCAAPERVQISDYRVTTGWSDNPVGQAPEMIVLRAFSLAGQPRLLVVDPATLATHVVGAAGVRWRPAPWPDVRGAVAGTPYGRALADAESHGDVLQDAGLTHLGASGGVSLTVDLCPSRHPLDRVIFTDLIAELAAVERPVPVAIAVTGVWLERHPRDLDWLLAAVQRGTLAVTWVNHSYNHRVDPAAPLPHNFLLEPGTDVTHEVLATERALLERGITPSVFFRFPGLVSSPALVHTIVGFGLIPLGSDAWLAKGQTPEPGSVVLVHGTGNEPLGVRRFVELLRRERGAVKAHHWLLLDLRTATVTTEAAQ